MITFMLAPSLGGLGMRDSMVSSSAASLNFPKLTNTSKSVVYIRREHGSFSQALQFFLLHFTDLPNYVVETFKMTSCQMEIKPLQLTRCHTQCQGQWKIRYPHLQCNCIVIHSIPSPSDGHFVYRCLLFFNPCMLKVEL